MKMILYVRYVQYTDNMLEILKYNLHKGSLAEDIAHFSIKTQMDKNHKVEKKFNWYL